MTCFVNSPQLSLIFFHINNLEELYFSSTIAYLTWITPYFSLPVVLLWLSYLRRSEMSINCAGLKGLSSMIIISATFIIIIFPQICDKHQIFSTPICILYLTGITYRSLFLRIGNFLLLGVCTSFAFSSCSLPEQRRNGQISSIDPFRDNCTTIFWVLNFIFLQLLSNLNKLNLFMFHLLSLFLVCVLCVYRQRVEVCLLCDEFGRLAHCQMLHTRYIEFGHAMHVTTDVTT